jgi:hypothetical protein
MGLSTKTVPENTGTVFIICKFSAVNSAKAGCVKNSHKWARMLKQQSSNTIYRLPIKENKVRFSASICSKQTEVCHFCFLFSANKRKLLFSLSSIFVYMYI